MGSERRDSSASSTSGSRSFFSKSFTGRSVSGETSKDSKGPLGLNTLYEPLSASDVIDLVFVHGLRGGSQSTWAKSNDATLFWPKEWLPTDESFRNTRIHSFGYDSNWEKGSTLRIQDFSRALLGAIADCPTIPRGTNVGLVFCHG